MLLLPLFAAAAEGALSMIPFGPHLTAAPGFDIGSLAKLYFLLSAIHGIRIYRLMLKPELEQHSGFEGPPLPFFQLLPGKKGFFFIRIVVEPAFVFVLATILGNINFITPGLKAYLHFCALCLVMKEFIDWHQCWTQIRDLLDARNAGPIIAKLMDDTATETERASIHLASFPRNLSPELHRETVVHIARSYDVRIPNAEV